MAHCARTIRVLCRSPRCSRRRRRRRGYYDEAWRGHLQYARKNMYGPLLIVKYIAHITCRHQLRNTLYGHQGPVYVTCLRPDGQVLLTGGASDIIAKLLTRLISRRSRRQGHHMEHGVGGSATADCGRLPRLYHGGVLGSFRGEKVRRFRIRVRERYNPRVPIQS